MNHVLKIASVLMVLLLFLFAGMNVYAADSGNILTSSGDDNYGDWDEDWNTVTGQCGRAISWKFTVATGMLELTGSGEIWSRYEHEAAWWNPADVKSIAFHGNIISIGEGAFSGCTNLTEMVIAESVHQIGDRAFEGCAKLSRLTLPLSVYEIGEKAFYGCSALRSVSLTNNLESVGNDCFAGCPKITDVYFTGSAHDWRLLSEGADMGMAENVSMHYSNQIVITSEPSGITTQSGKNVKFSVTASAEKELNYQWYYRKKGAAGWSIWKGHTTPTTYATSNDTWDGMRVYCRIDDMKYHISSEPAEISLTSVLKITSEPEDITAKVGEKTVFSVKAQGVGLKYQWYYKKAGASDWSVWKNHTTPTTSAVANHTWDGMRVYCKVIDSSNHSVSSRTAVIMISDMPLIENQSGNVSVKVGENVNFRVRAQGSLLKYQWYYMKDGAKCWSIWKNHTTASTYAVSNATWNKMRVYCVITDSFGRQTASKPVTVTLIK
jgi:hypothetical protein